MSFIKINTDGLAYSFNLNQDPYGSLARVMVDGHTALEMNTSELEIEFGPSSVSEGSFQLNAWKQVFDKVKTFIATCEPTELAKKIQESQNPKLFLFKHVNGIA